MKTKTAERCMSIIAVVLTSGNPGGLSYVVEALRQEIEKNEMRSRLTKETIKIKEKGVKKNGISSN